MQSKELEKIALTALDDLKAINVVVLEIGSLTTIADTMIVCSGRSSLHVKSLAQNVITEAKKHKATYIKFEGEKFGEWIIIDLGDVIVHVMQAAARDFYKLEDLWEPIQLQREMNSRG